MFIKLNDVLKYLVCPYKLKFDQELDQEYTQVINNAILNESLLNKAKAGKASVAYVNRSINTVWQKLRIDNQIHKPRADFFIKTKKTIIATCQDVNSLGEVIAINYNSNIEHEEHIIEVPVVSMYLKNNVLGFLYNYQESSYQYYDNSIIHQLYSYVTRKLFNDLKTKAIPEVKVFKSQTARLHQYKSIQSLVKLKPIMTSLINTYVRKEYYPTPTPYTCLNCRYNSICEWRSK